MSASVLLVGCGNMGVAMLKGWLDADPGLRAHVVEPVEAFRARAAALGAAAVGAATGLPDGFQPDLIFLAVKPQVMVSILPDYRPWAGGAATFVSIAAGTTLATLSAGLPGPTLIIRCMPNTPAAIGAGMMACYANDLVGEPAAALTGRLLSASGEVAWIGDEGLMDTVTAVSGSGPAYVFHLIECLSAAGVTAGLPQALAARLALQTVAGAARLAAASADDPATLRQQVTSPGGTTAAALGVLMNEQRLCALMTEAVEAARARSVELAQD